MFVKRDIFVYYITDAKLTSACNATTLSLAKVLVTVTRHL